MKKVLLLVYEHYTTTKGTYNNTSSLFSSSRYSYTLPLFFFFLFYHYSSSPPPPPTTPIGNNNLNVCNNYTLLMNRVNLVNWKKRNRRKKISQMINLQNKKLELKKCHFRCLRQPQKLLLRRTISLTTSFPPP